MTEKYSLKFINFTLAVFLMGFIFVVLKELESILLPFFIAVVVFFVFLPVYSFLVNKRVPAGIAVVIILLIVLILANTLSVFIVASVNSFSTEFPLYEQKFAEKLNNLVGVLNLDKEDVEKFTRNFDIKAMFMEGKFTTAITNVLSSVTGLMGNFILIMFYLIFLLSESSSIKERIKLAFSEEKTEQIGRTSEAIINNVKDYISGKTLLAAIQSVVIAIVLWAVGVDFYLIWAVLFFFTDFIPNIGSLAATILVGLAMFLQFDSVITPVVMIVVLVLIQNLKGNVLEPKILGNKLDLSPIVLLFSLVFWGYIWGIPGMILSVPIMAIIKIIFMNFEATKPLAIMMSYNLTSIKDK